MNEAKANVKPESVKEITLPQRKKAWTKIEIFGLFLVFVSILTLLISPETLSGLFNSVIEEVFPIIVDVFLTGQVGIAIIVSVIIGRSLERLGFTDALVRLFVPVTRMMKVNSTVIIPSIYNILGDINAAGKIAGPILVKAKATKAEQKIAIATMVQSQQSFSTFMLGLVALTTVGANAFVVVMIAVFLPLFIVPFLLSKTIYRDVKPVDFNDLPTFTPNTRALPTLFNAAREGAELLFLLIIPAVAAIFTIIGVLEFAGIWSYIESGLSSALLVLGIDPKTGILSILASPTLAMGTLAETAAEIDPRLVVGSFVLASSGLPASSVFGQIPVIWANYSDLNEREAMGAALLGISMRLVTAFLIVYFLTPVLL